jgi:glycosyltransferase involved in cell wall biosynthesis
LFTKKKVIVSVINDLVTDSRVNKTCTTLEECGYKVTLVGRKLSNSLPLPNWPFKTKRIKLIFIKGPLFYFFFNLRLFFILLFTKTDLLYSNDLDTLLPNYLVSRLKKIPLIYDSHELFTEVPELARSPVKRKIWEAIEAWIIPKLNYCITVSDGIAALFEKKYGIKFHVVRNIPSAPKQIVQKTKSELKLPENKNIILLQGAGINIDRGAEELVEAMAHIENAILLIIGGGDVWPALKEKIKTLNLNDRVVMMEKLPKQELMQYTRIADVGLSIDKNTNLNYYYSLPNKIFDYIHAGIPILASRLPEIEKIITRYHIGDFINEHDPGHIASKLNEMLRSPKLKQYRANTAKASVELNWENEKALLVSVILGVSAK